MGPEAKRMPRHSRRTASAHTPPAAHFLGGTPAGRPLDEIRARMLPFLVRQLSECGYKPIKRLWRRFADRYSTNGTRANPFNAPYPLIRAFIEHYLHPEHTGNVDCYNVTKEFILPFFDAAGMVDTDFTNSIGHSAATTWNRVDETEMAAEVIWSIQEQGGDWGFEQEDRTPFVDPRLVITTTGDDDSRGNAVARYEMYQEASGKWNRIIVIEPADDGNADPYAIEYVQVPEGAYRLNMYNHASDIRWSGSYPLLRYSKPEAQAPNHQQGPEKASAATQTESGTWTSEQPSTPVATIKQSTKDIHASEQAGASNESSTSQGLQEHEALNARDEARGPWYEEEDYEHCIMEYNGRENEIVQTLPPDLREQARGVSDQIRHSKKPTEVIWEVEHEEAQKARKLVEEFLAKSEQGRQAKVTLQEEEGPLETKDEVRKHEITIAPRSKAKNVGGKIILGPGQVFVGTFKEALRADYEQKKSKTEGELLDYIDNSTPEIVKRIKEYVEWKIISQGKDGQGKGQIPDRQMMNEQMALAHIRLIQEVTKLWAKGAKWDHFLDIGRGGSLTEQEKKEWKKWTTDYVAGSKAKAKTQREPAHNLRDRNAADSKEAEDEQAAQQQREQGEKRRPTPPTLEDATTPPPGLAEETTANGNTRTERKGEPNPSFVLP